jgi:hypothetical protein
MIKLTGEQQRQMNEEGWPPRFVNLATGEEFVLLHAAMFERVRPVLETEDEIAAVEEMYPVLTEVVDESPAGRESA